MGLLRECLFWDFFGHVSHPTLSPVAAAGQQGAGTLLGGPAGAGVQRGDSGQPGEFTASFPGAAWWEQLPLNPLCPQVKVNVLGAVVEQGSTGFAPDARSFSLHAAIYAARPDIRCIVRLHTPAAAAVRAESRGTGVGETMGLGDTGAFGGSWFWGDLGGRGTWGPLGEVGFGGIWKDV